MTDELVIRHHGAQKLIARNTVAELAPLWGILTFSDLKGTTADWLRAVRPVVEKGYLTSQYVAAEFARNYRASLLPSAEPLDIDLPPNPLGLFGNQMIHDREAQLRIMVSMKVTGPDYVSKLLPMEETEAMRKGFSKSVGAATRLTLAGGRRWVALAAHVDPLASGVQRVAGESSCTSCRDRLGPVLKPAGLEAMSAGLACHDFGTCSAKIVY